MKSTISTLVLIFTAVSLHAASVKEWMKGGLLHPDLIAAVREELGLTQDQQTKLTQQLAETRRQAEPLEQKVNELETALNNLLQDPSASADAASAQLTKLLEAEAALKQLQLRSLIGVRNALTPEQIEKARKIGPVKATTTGDAESKLAAKAGKLKAAMEGLGFPATDAIKERGSKIEALIKSGDATAAEAALDALIKDSRLEALSVADEAVDFAKFEAGSTDLDALRKRYDDVQAATQRVVSLPLMRQMLKARDAFEDAKKDQDPVKVGRVLTYLEGRLKKD